MVQEKNEHRLFLTRYVLPVYNPCTVAAAAAAVPHIHLFAGNETICYRDQQTWYHHNKKSRLQTKTKPVRISYKKKMAARSQIDFLLRLSPKFSTSRYKIRINLRNIVV